MASSAPPDGVLSLATTAVEQILNDSSNLLEDVVQKSIDAVCEQRSIYEVKLEEVSKDLVACVIEEASREAEVTVVLEVLVQKVINKIADNEQHKKFVDEQVKAKANETRIKELEDLVIVFIYLFNEPSFSLYFIVHRQLRSATLTH